MARIFVVEDEPSLTLLYRTNLERKGHHVTCFHNGREAFNNLDTERPDLIILDIQMAAGDGLEMMKKMLDQRSGIPVIINSAYSHYKNDFISWAAEAYVVKSSDLSELNDAVDNVLGRFAPLDA
ncbi:MAG: response regulator [Bacteroidetes bacterium]|nr:response regulator [Bacteroidota bacterium]